MQISRLRDCHKWLHSPVVAIVVACPCKKLIAGRKFNSMKLRLAGNGIGLLSLNCARLISARRAKNWTRRFYSAHLARACWQTFSKFVRCRRFRMKRFLSRPFVRPENDPLFHAKIYFRYENLQYAVKLLSLQRGYLFLYFFLIYRIFLLAYF